MTSGIIRKIDELGRIVLPKELRKYLNINTGDDFQITVNDEKIILEKYSRLKNYESEIYNIINCFSNELNINILFTINDKLLSYNEKINDDLYKIILQRKVYMLDLVKLTHISKSINIEGKILIMPIVLNSDLLGSIIIVTKGDLDSSLKYANIISRMVKNLLN